MKIKKLDSALQLSNDGKLELFFTGVGSAFGKTHYQNNVIIIKGKDHLLIDCGTLCPLAMYNYKSSLSLIKNVLITHSHADHIGGMEELALSHRYITKDRPNLVITDEYKEILWEQSLKGGLSYGERHETLYNKSSSEKYLVFEDYFNQLKPVLIADKPRPVYEINVGSINIKLFRTMHYPEQALSWKDSAWSTGVLIDNRILFPSDTRFDKDLLTWMNGEYNPEVIFHDCQPYTGGVHAGIDELKTLDSSLKSKIHLCHYGDSFSSYDAKANGFAGLAQQGVYYQF